MSSAAIAPKLRNISFPAILLAALFACSGALSGCSDVVGVGTPAVVAASPADLTFDATRIGASSSRTLTLLETSRHADAVIRAISLEGTGAGVFTLSEPLPVTIPKGGQITWTVTFAPTQLETASAKLVLVIDGYGVHPPDITLTGTGLGADHDGDGASTDEGDCDDESSSTGPDAPEVCDGVDNDCDGHVDDNAQDMTAWHADNDQDGYGAGQSAMACDAPTGYVASSSDCDDQDSSLHPGAAELCDGIDQDCDGLIDDNPVSAPAPGGAPTWYADEDGDGYGRSDASDGSSPLVACQRPPGYQDNNLDCDDQQATIHPEAAELCNHLDDDCDRQIDEEVLEPPTWYADRDQDGYGDAADTLAQCEAAGRVAVSGDCDDAVAAVHPGAQESCNSVDDDCNGQIDDGLVYLTYHPDADADGFGASDTSISRCAPPAGYLTSGTDCDDTQASVHPGMAEACNGIDDDCNGRIDDGLTQTTFHLDADQDGFGDPAVSLTACATPPGYTPDDRDCNDAQASINPAAPETCNGIDDDCNALIDDNPTSAPRFYQDQDGDLFGGSVSTRACVAPSGYVGETGDCDDLKPTVHPGAPEYCNELDDDCDGLVDDNAVDAVTWAEDSDGDGYGDGPLVTGCVGPAGSVPVDEAHPEDCDDSDDQSYPGATETCDGVDYNCDGIWSPASCSGCHVIKGDTHSLYPTIQQALDAAALGIDFGGEIRVCPGTYTENLRFDGAPVMLVGEDPLTTILDGSKCSRGADQCSTVAFIDGESASSGLSGFTIQGGRGSRRSTFQSGGSAVTAGGGVLVTQASPRLEDLIITKNQAGEGGGLLISGGTPALIDLQLIAQQQGQNGGGAYLEQTAVTFDGGAISGNQVTGQGGGLYATQSTVTLSGLLLSGNNSAGDGGGAVLSGCTSQWIDVGVDANSSNATSGGGVLISGGKATIAGGSFTHNSVTGGNATQGGAGIFLRNSSGSSISDAQISNNVSGGYGAGLAAVDCSGLMVQRTTLTFNTASAFGGALSIYSSSNTASVTLDALQVQSNQARYGGGLWSTGAAVNLSHSRWSRNSCVEFGGAVYLAQGKVNVVNNLFLANSASRQGGGLYLSSATGQLLNNAITNNAGGEKGSGLVIEASSSLPTVLNNIISHGTGSGVGIDAPSGLAALFHYNDVYANTLQGFTSDSTNANLDPLFNTGVTNTSIDPALWNMHLKPGSPCINHGSSEAQYNDADGTRNDMGGYGGPGSVW